MKVNQMLQYTSDIGQNVDVQKFFLPEKDPCYQSVCWNTVKKLLQLHLFHDAEMFATVARLPIDDLFLLQVINMLNILFKFHIALNEGISM